MSQYGHLPVIMSAVLPMVVDPKGQPMMWETKPAANFGKTPGAGVDQEAITAFDDMYMKNKYRWIIFRIDRRKKHEIREDAKSEQIVVEYTGPWKGTDSRFKDFRRKLNQKEPRFILFDVDFTTQGNGDPEDLKIRDKRILLVSWCPDVAPLRMKMLFATSKVNMLSAIQQGRKLGDVELHDWDEISEENFIEIAKRPKVWLWNEFKTPFNFK